MNSTNEILIIGGGIIGLSLAIELKLRGATVTVLSRDVRESATYAAAGMLAPQAEKIPPSPMLDLSLRSRELYPAWTAKLEGLIDGNTAGYWPCGILSPVYQMPAISPAKAQSNGAGTVSHPESAQWLDQVEIRQRQPALSPEVVGGWWYPQDGQVDNRALFRVLRKVAHQLNIDVREGIFVEAICQHGRIFSIKTSIGELQADHYVLGAGAWSKELLPIPVMPKKGQMLSINVPDSSTVIQPIQTILFGEEIYIIPRQNGRILLGATSEDVEFTPGTTPQGIQQLLQAAIRLYPALKHYAIHDLWWGFRPATPDELPILGPSACDNLTLATGHYRNGILLAPITATLLADLILEKQVDPLLPHFHYSRFLPTPTSSTFATPLLSMSSAPNRWLPTTPISGPDLGVVDPPLIIAGKSFQSRLMTGTGKYRNREEMQESIEASGCEIVTVAVRRVQNNALGHEGLAEALDWTKVWMLPNTAGCQTAEEAIRVARLGREMAKLLGQEDNNFVKLEVIPDPTYLLPDPIDTLKAAEQLVKEGFAVLPYINADPLLAKRLEEAGCATVMPLGSPIGSGQGIKTAANIAIIISNAKVPVVVDAGIGTPSEAAQAMELGADALLVNSAIALATRPAAMARAMGLATVAGRLAYLAGRIPIKEYASASSPMTGLVS